MTKTCGMNCSIAVRLGGIGRSTDICAISGLGEVRIKFVHLFIPRALYVNITKQFA